MWKGLPRPFEECSQAGVRSALVGSAERRTVRVVDGSGPIGQTFGLVVGQRGQGPAQMRSDVAEPSWILPFRQGETAQAGSFPGTLAGYET